MFIVGGRWSGGGGNEEWKKATVGWQQLNLFADQSASFHGNYQKIQSVSSCCISQQNKSNKQIKQQQLFYCYSTGRVNFNYFIEKANEWNGMKRNEMETSRCLPL